jgi:non-heme chloroperoxidase
LPSALRKDHLSGGEGEIVASVITNDGVRLFYQDAGSGRPLIIAPGIAQTASMFVHQVEGLRDRYRVIVYDHRGHGESARPPHGYRIARLAKDLDDLLDALGLDDVTLLGWSMGCSVAWSYYDLFGPKRLSRLILVDGTVFMCRTPEMTKQDVADTGAVWDAAGAVAAAGALRGDPEATVRPFVSSFLTEKYADEDWFVGEALKMPAEAAAALLFDQAFGDWRDVAARITIPTLIIGASRSHVPLSVHEWLQHAIPGAKLAVMRDRAHLMFYEEPDTFNELVADFIG